MEPFILAQSTGLQDPMVLAERATCNISGALVSPMGESRPGEVGEGLAGGGEER